MRRHRLLFSLDNLWTHLSARADIGDQSGPVSIGACAAILLIDRIDRGPPGDSSWGNAAYWSAEPA